MQYTASKFKKPHFRILWFFFTLIFLYELINFQKFHLNFLLSILIQYFLLYLMYYLYIYYVQTIFRLRELPTHINFKKINLSFNFKEPTFAYSLKKDNYLMFDVYLHNDYFEENFPHKYKLNENLRYHIHTVWKHVLLYLKRYKIFLAKILMYCFLFGISMILITILSNEFIDFNSYSTDKDLYKKLYTFFIFISFSFWLYVTILILSSEAIIGNINNTEQHEIYAIYNNANIFMETEELLNEINRSNDLIGTYINISTSILYFSFLTILGSIL